MSSDAVRYVIYAILVAILVVSALRTIRKRRESDAADNADRLRKKPQPTELPPAAPRAEYTEPAVAAVEPVPAPEPVAVHQDSVEEPVSRSLGAESNPKREKLQIASPLVRPAVESRDQTETRVEASDIPGADTSDYMFGSLTPVMASLLPESDRRRDDVKKELQSAGHYEPHAYENISALRWLGIVVPLLLFGAMLLLVPASLEWLALILIVVMPILGWAYPRLSLRREATERKRQVESAMPDLLDLLSMCVSQGMTLPHSLNRIAGELQDVHPALAQELRIVVEQTRLYDLQTALENFRRRIDVPEVHSFTNLVIQTERMGTSVSNALDDYSDGIRQTLRQRADEKANKATFRLLFPVSLCLLPAVLLFLVGPAIMEMSVFFGGEGSEIFNQSTEQVQQVREMN